MQKTIGAFETIDFPAFGMHGVSAKVDTGALTSCLDCRVLRVVHEADGTPVLEFKPEGSDSMQRTADFFEKWVRSSNGAKVDRFFVQTTIVLEGTAYPILVSLADRSDMKVPVLLGRRFLREHHFLVDSRRNSR
ncbi:MAG TPA: RimK/LysX family protein [Candidatus Saccharimonadales bacterium]|jgi:hypothetical protein|nr:RimK/LysX family protein [Candidatus Saccharimonadales bacterium]